MSFHEIRCKWCWIDPHIKLSQALTRVVRIVPAHSESLIKLGKIVRHGDILISISSRGLIFDFVQNLWQQLVSLSSDQNRLFLYLCSTLSAEIHYHQYVACSS